MRNWWFIVSAVVLVVAVGATVTTVMWLNSSSTSNDTGCTALLPEELGKRVDNDIAIEIHEAIADDPQVDEELHLLLESNVEVSWSAMRITVDGVYGQGLCTEQGDRWQLQRVAVHAGDRVAIAGSFEEAYAGLSAS